MISIVCVYNNEKILNDALLKSLKNQTANYELIALDNTEGKFKSAAEALNHGGKQTNGKYIVFVHQDVELSSNSWLADAEKWLDLTDNLGIAGVAGMSDIGGSNEERGRNIIKHGNPATEWVWGNPIRKPTSVQTLDECLVIIPKSVFNVLQFDEITCDAWHLYTVDYCLSAKEMGFEVYAIPMNIYHLSAGVANQSCWQVILRLGPLPSGYYKTLKKLLNKHKSSLKEIYTTCGNWDTSYPLIFQRVWYFMKEPIWPMIKAGLTHPFKKLKKQGD